jgi:formamidopyrimidine-DNA glycosylase
MPELPEVETIVRALRPAIVGRSVVDVQVTWPRHVAHPSPAELRDQLLGQAILAVERRGKYLILSLDRGQSLLIHLKMSGQLMVVESPGAADPHAHTIFLLDDGRELRFRDTRKFGRVYLVASPEQVVSSLGPEPFSPEFSDEWLQARLRGRRRMLKPLLLDQSFLAGVGNIYADEALYRAGIHPRRLAGSLTPAETRDLRMGILDALRAGISGHGATISDFRRPDGSPGSAQEEFLVYGRSGSACYRCGSIIQRIVVGARSTHLCPACQLERK